MPTRRKIDLGKVSASLFTLCTHCGYKIQPGEVQRISFDQMRCPECRADFIPGKERAK